jgi:hypothetical protein
VQKEEWKMDLSNPDKKVLWTNAGNLCSYSIDSETCNTELVKLDNGKYIVLGEECHIVGEKPKAARYIEDYPQRETYYNAILMCGVHHKIIDDNVTVYTVEILHVMKDRHEKIIREAIQNKTLRPLVIKDSEFLTIVEKAKRAVGMEVNRQAQLSNVRSELRVGDVQEAIGFSTNQGLTGSILSCSSCKQFFPAAFVGTPPEYVECPHCGHKQKMHR